MRFILVFIIIRFIYAVEIVVEPYLQDGHPTSMTIMWETDIESESIVEYGESLALGMIVSGTPETGLGLSQIHTVVLLDLFPSTRYYYKISTNSVESEIFILLPINSLSSSEICGANGLRSIKKPSKTDLSNFSNFNK